MNHDIVLSIISDPTHVSHMCRSS